MKQRLKGYRAAILHFLKNPKECLTEAETYEYFSDGILLVEDGKVFACGDAETVLAHYQQSDILLTIESHPDRLIMPGFIDTHTHYPQTDIMGSYGAQLLDWLHTYTFPMEARFSEFDVAQQVAHFFCDELLRNGTTTVMAFATVHAASVDAIFHAADQRNMRLISGKVMMDRHAPENVCDSAETSYQQSYELIQKWHHKSRLSYAVTPRFAPTSSKAQLQLAGELFAETEGVYLQSHLAENQDEVAWVQSLFPNSRSYLDVYEQYGLLGERAIYAHCLYLEPQDYQRMAKTHTAMAFCPSSNLFLGSGLFDLQAAQAADIKVGMATDIGGGTSFSMLRTLGDAYKVLQLNGQSLSAYQAFYQATLGSAEALTLSHCLGNFISGKEADFIMLDLEATPLMARRMQHTTDLQEQLFALMTLGDERNIAATYIMGECRYKR